MARIKIESLPKEVEMSRAELRAIMGGGGEQCVPPTSESEADEIPMTMGDEAGVIKGMVSARRTRSGTNVGNISMDTGQTSVLIPGLGKEVRIR